MAFLPTLLIVVVPLILVALVIARVVSYMDRPRVKVIEADGVYYVKSRVLCLGYLTEMIYFSREDAVRRAKELSAKPAPPRQVWP